MCECCSYEYTHPDTRRYHAQPVCCNDCGPRLKMLDPEGNPYDISREVGLSESKTSGNTALPKKTLSDRKALLAARRVIRSGGVLAVKGIGGFHLCCDARCREAVDRLRVLKQRPFKPFATMMRDLETVRRECEVSHAQETLLNGPQKPILLLKKRSSGTLVSESAAPDNPYLGVMLPYAPVQMLLFHDPDDPDSEMTDCLIMTSANPKGAPICRTDEEVLGSVGGMCDAVLTNDRLIRTRADDSVMGWRNGRPSMIRRSRGYAPLPVMLNFNSARSQEAEVVDSVASGSVAAESEPRRVLAAGGELKNTFCLAKGRIFYPSAYVGDMADIRTVTAWEESEKRMEELLQIEPEVVVCDLHPKYRSTMITEELAEKRGIPLFKVQHHYAHVLSCMAENNEMGSVIGVSMDGTGYGTDDSIWGGEFLYADTQGFQRLGSLGSFQQAGGDLSSTEGWRIACALLKQYDETRGGKVAEALSLGSPGMRSMLYQMIDKNINTVKSTSMGRLFDAASAVLGLRQKSTCEGEASMVLQFAAERWLEGTGSSQKSELATAAAVATSSPVNPNPPAFKPDRSPASALDWTPALHYEPSEDKPIGGEVLRDQLFRISAENLIYELAERRLAGENIDKLAWNFHMAVVKLVVRGCEEARDLTGCSVVALTGGVLQNLPLSTDIEKQLKKQGFQVLVHSMIPANDGGIALGQALYGMRKQRRNKTCV